MVLMSPPLRASNEGLLRPRVARAQKIIRLHPFHRSGAKKAPHALASHLSLLQRFHPSALNTPSPSESGSVNRVIPRYRPPSTEYSQTDLPLLFQHVSRQSPKRLC